MKREISVIVPVYNTREYLEDCVNSVLKQTCTDFELILIDDGSEDGSKDICERLAEKDKRISIICQKHKGVSAARNAGIEAACGKYLFFLDSDDTIHPQLLEALHKLQEEKHTVLAAAGLCCGDSGWKKENSPNWEGEYLDNYKARQEFPFSHTKARLDTIGGKMILREAIKGQRFDEKLAHGEDTWFLCQVVFAGAEVIVLPRDWYYYKRHRKREYSVDCCKSMYKCHRMICNYEARNDRIAGAVHAEWILLCEMVTWKEIGKRNQNVRLEEYVKNLIKAEKKQEIFWKVDWCRRMVFYLGCIYYPLYKLIADFMDWYHAKSYRG